MGTEFLETICPLGQNWLGTVCPEGPINWGPIVEDQMSGDYMCLGPNVSQPLKSLFPKQTDKQEEILPQRSFHCIVLWSLAARNSNNLSALILD